MFLVFVNIAVAAVPQLISLQGRLTNPSTGNPYTTSLTITFSIWDSLILGSSVWSETQTVTPDSNGFFDVFLGGISSLPSLTDNSYLQLEINGEVLSPRQSIVSSAFAIRSAISEDLSCIGCINDSKISGPISGSKILPDFGNQAIIRQISRVQGYIGDGMDNGGLFGRALTFVKTQSNTGLRVSWSDNFRVFGEGKACRWEIKFNDISCTNPGGLYFDKYESSTDNSHDPSSFFGTCFGLAAGTYTIRGYVGPTPGFSGSDCYTGYSSQLFSIEVEEVY